MRSQLPTLSFLFVFGFFLTSCRSVKDPEFMGIEKFAMPRVGLKESTLSINIHYFNPNNYRLKLKNAEGEVWIDGNDLGHFSVDSLIHIPALDSFYIPVNLALNMKTVLMNSAALLLKNEVTLKINGKARVGKGGIFINYPLLYEKKYLTEELFHLNKDKMNTKEPG